MNELTAQPAAPELEFLTVKQTAKYLNMSPSTVYQLIETKRMRHYRFGEGSGGIRVNRQELIEFVQRCRVEERQGKMHVEIRPLRTVVLKHSDSTILHPIPAAPSPTRERHVR